MIEYFESETTCATTISRVARTLDSWGTYLLDSPIAKAASEKWSQPLDTVLWGYFRGDAETHFRYEFVLSTPGRWLAAAAADTTRQAREALNTGDNEEAARLFANADDLCARAYIADKREAGKHLIVDLVRALNYMACSRWEDAVNTALPHTADNAYDYDLYTNDKPGLDHTGKPLTTGRHLADAIVATSRAHLSGQESLARAAAEKAVTDGGGLGSLAQGYFVLGMLSRAEGSGKAEKETNNLLAVSASSDPERPDIAAATIDTEMVFPKTTPELIGARTSFWDPTTEPTLAELRARTADDKRAKIVDEALAELDSYIGMANIKQRVRDLIATVELQKLQEEAGLQRSEFSTHMVFTGPPGVGKTSVARVVGRILFGLGAIKSDVFKEVTRPDFVGEFQGHTAKKTLETLESATPGTCFHDEAYSLVKGENDTFGLEAIDTIVPYIENHRNEMCYIAAGYPEDMERFLRSNTGLSSRLGTRIEFESYTPTEIADICELIASKSGKTLVPEAKEYIARELTDKLMDPDTGLSLKGVDGTNLVDTFGNGRGARRVVEATNPPMSDRISKMGDISQMPVEDRRELLSTITLADTKIAVEAVMDEVFRQATTKI